MSRQKLGRGFDVTIDKPLFALLFSLAMMSHASVPSHANEKEEYLHFIHFSSGMTSEHTLLISTKNVSTN